jgi:hypothetical protein
MMIASKLFASCQHGASLTNRASHIFSTLTRLWAFSCRRKENIGEAATRSVIHPLIVCLNSSLIEVS